MKISEQSVTLIDNMGSDLSVVNAARVSFAKTSWWEYEDDPNGPLGRTDHLSEKDQKLIAYLAKHSHWTPFAHCFLSFRIKAPIFVARQLVKHQVGLAWNEVSRRYVDDEPEFYFPDVWRGRAENAKQGSSEERCDAVYDNGTGDWNDSEAMFDLYESDDEFARWAMKMALEAYNRLLKSGAAPEQARMVLPQNTMTEWIWSGSLAAFARVCKLRLDPHAQKETQEVAQKINDLVPNNFEHSWKTLLQG